MSKLCERPGCSEHGAAAYGMVPEDLLFWIAPLADAPNGNVNVLCRRHADAMVVPMGWTLDDRRIDTLRLFTPRPSKRPTAAPPVRPPRRTAAGPRPEQLQIDGTGEIERPVIDEPAGAEPAEPIAAAPWQPDFDVDDDLDGLLEVNSPLLARAFRGTGRRRS